MDKFGIFNILNSLLGSKTDTQSSSSASSPDLNNLLNTLLSPKQQTPDKPKQSAPPITPLQTSMISTMNSHDEFIKRVMKKNTTVK